MLIWLGEAVGSSNTALSYRLYFSIPAIHVFLAWCYTSYFFLHTGAHSTMTLRPTCFKA
jgi:hypothetical protein